MATPSIVQSAFARGNTSPQTLTLSAAPTVGNWLVFVHTGYSNALSPPPGLTQVQTGSAQANEITEAWYRVVQAGDGTSWAFSGEADWADLAVFEVSGVQSLLPANGANSGGGSTTLQTGSLNAAGDAACLRLLAVEWDTNAAATTPAGWTLLSPSTWQGSSTGNHDAGIWSIPPSLSGVQSLTLSAALNSYPGVWLDLQVSAIPPSMRVTQAGAEVWLNLYRPPSKGQPAICVIC